MGLSPNMEAAIAEALLSGEREAQVLAAREIGKLTSKQKQKLAEKGVISSLILMLHAQDYESIEAGLFALLNLAFGSERNKVRIAKCGAIPAILKVLQWHNETLFELALAALLILSSCSANKPEIAACGAIQLLFELLDSQFPQIISHQAKLDIISTLQNLSTSPQIIPQIVLSGGLISLIELIYESEKSSELAEKAMALLESIVSSSEIALNQASESGGMIRMLVEAVEEGTAACKEHAAAILLLICRNCRDRYRVMILREGAMPGLLQLSVDSTRRGREKAKALLLLLRDCSNGEPSSPSRIKHSKKVMMEEVMRQIDGEGRGGTSIQMVEEMIAKLRT
ncbi:Ubiquitin--protein ligase [Handroanthus impetiginosus]|uniref:Ubiquitin--protein ligase n=1 Tax=Handroanthus impetiginosus TaxID=429701 RepID=A0A2G9HK63_9LAMI|nr:Ubiquitin--protein ligase [Handroanthus impetiginosus]